MKFKVGESVWWAKCRWETIKVLCPTCFGKKEVTLILGNGDQVILECRGCSSGFNPPSGYVSEYDYVAEPECVTITGMRIEVHGDEESVRYNSSCCSYDEEELFYNKEDAVSKSKEKKRALELAQRTRAEYIKKDVHKNFSWNANYHMREAKRMRKQAEYHDSKAVLCKERSKDKGDSHEI